MSPRIRIQAWASVDHPIADDSSTLPALRERMTELCRKPFRRVDRFIQLALIGSARCAEAQAILPDCGVYLASAHGDIGISQDVIGRVVDQSGLPKPLSFVNTVSNAASFYVAQNLDLHGRSCFAISQGFEFEAALRLARFDLEQQRGSQALVGCVDECTLPLAAHRLRLGLPADAALAEGSHWLLLSTDSGPGPELLDMQWLPDAAAVAGWLAEVNAPAACMLHDAGVPPELLAHHAGPQQRLAACGYPGAWVGELLQTLATLAPEQTVILLRSDADGRFSVARLVA